MIRHILAVDRENGIAKDGKIPWKLKGDSKYFIDQIHTHGSRVLVAANTYAEIGRSIADYTYVLSHRDFAVEKGEVVHDLQQFIRTLKGDLWVIGGSSLYKETLEYADELYITRIDETYGCDRFYPSDLSDFTLVSQSAPLTEHDTSYVFEIYDRNKPAQH